MHGTEYSVSGVIRTCKETYQFCLLFMFIEGVHKGKTVDAFFSHRCYVVLALSHERIDRIEKNSQFYRIIDDLVTHTLPRQQKRNPSLLIVISHQQKPMEFMSNDNSRAVINDYDLYELSKINTSMGTMRC